MAEQLYKGITALKKFFESGSAPIGMKEMQDFWKSLTADEKTSFVTHAEAAVNA